MAEFVAKDHKIKDKRNSEFAKFEAVLDNEQLIESKEKKAAGNKGKNSAVDSLSKALEHYKNERIGTEDELIKCIKKVNLDKPILFREKKSVLWKESAGNKEEDNIN